MALPKETIKYIKYLLRNYNDMPSKIERLSKETQYVTLAQIKRIEVLKEQHHVIEQTYNELPSEKKKVISLYYFYDKRKYNWQQVSSNTGYSEKHCMNISNKYVKEVGKRLGLID